MTAGTVVSRPTTSSMPQSFGSASVKPLEVMPTTNAFGTGRSTTQLRLQLEEAIILDLRPIEIGVAKRIRTVTSAVTGHYAAVTP